jgi:hypothetical protein
MGFWHTIIIQHKHKKDGIMSEFVANLAETSYEDEALFAIQAVESVIVDQSLVSNGSPNGFNSET